ncbi:peptidoglycan-binding protein [Alkalilimnicola ehrlichii]|uniref:Peptidoglycan-binding protein n=1 Tax=Alkalilimnicola ehrlichii TaxID=351052 RepID=A0A3E0X2X9_9GAMM|nr:N-acetylmuramidase family protein [Alkalilimnicola ehrlichii]RFA31338.1 peptidoglycan-binding protein [Alkalilimnicola ehrlichii]RFA39388.1 peptidoglycan-binding protein [Alkalilimnicola ehrlichii]
MMLRRGDSGDAVANLQRQLQSQGFALTVDGRFGPATEATVRAYQQREGLAVDGIAGPQTRAALASADEERTHRQHAIRDAAERLGVDIASIHAVAEVESRGNGFLPDGRPQILFERHIFRRRLLAHGIDPQPHQQQRPDLISPHTGGYRGGAAEYQRLAAAEAIHRQAAIESASWGRFQIMGFHWQRLGYEAAETFRAAMEVDDKAHLDAFIRFIATDNGLQQALRGRDWARFARLYNGPAYAKNQYDLRLQQAWERHSTAGLAS